MADRDATFDLIARDKTGPGVTGASRGLKRVSDDAKQTQRDIDEAVKRTSSGLDRARSRLDAWSNDGTGIGRKLTAGVASGLLGMAAVGSKAGGMLTAGLSTALSASGPILGIALVGAGLAAASLAAPAIGAALSAGIILALGGGVLAAGIAGALKSPKIDEIINGRKTTAVQEFVDAQGNRTAGATMETRASGGLAETGRRVFDTFSKPFIDPLARALDLVNLKLTQWEGPLGRLGAKAAPLIDRLAPALITMAERSFPGIERALDKAGPTFDALAESLPGLGSSIGKFFDLVAESGPGTAQFLRDAIDGLGALIEHTGRWIVFLSNMYLATRDAFLKSEAAVLRFVSASLGALHTVLAASADAARALGMPEVGAKLDAAARKVAGFRDSVNSTLAQVERQIDVNVAVRLTGVASVTGALNNLRAQAQGIAAGIGARMSAGGGWVPARAAAEFAGGAGFSASAGGGMSRTGGPTVINQELTVLLDGEPVRTIVDRSVAASERRTEHRARVGRR